MIEQETVESLSRIDFEIKRYQQTLQHYKVILMGQYGDLEKSKVYFALGQVKKLEEILQTSQQLRTEQKQVINQYIECLKQQQNGIYDFKQMYKDRYKNFFIENVTNFVSTKISIYQFPGMGRGYIAMEDIKVGEIIMVEKAFLFGDFDQMKKQLDILKFIASDDEKNMYLSLLGGGQNFDYDSMIKKSDQNCFDISQQLYEHDNYQFDDYQSGLFLESSIFNHACNYNVESIFFNNLVIKIASKNIKKGHQLYNIYNDLAIDGPEEFKQQLISDYFFDCQCNVCRKTKGCQEDWNKFDKLHKKYRHILDKIKVTKDSEILRQLLQKADTLVQQITSLLTSCNWNYQLYIQDMYRTLISQLVKNMLICKVNQSHVIYITNKALTYIGINSEKCIQHGTLELVIDDTDQFTSITFTNFLIYAAFIYKYCKDDRWINILIVAKKYFEMTGGVALQLEFTTFYRPELTNYELYDQAIKFQENVE